MPHPLRRQALNQFESVSVCRLGDHQESLCRRAIIKNHCADGQASKIIPPTGYYQESSRRRAIITNHCADGHPANLIQASRQRAPHQSYSSTAPTGASQILFKHRADGRYKFKHRADGQY
jgi:hypothetical protein